VVLLLLVCVKLSYVNINEESVLVVKDLGIQFTRCGIFGQKNKAVH